MILPPSPPSIGCLFVLYICTVLKRKEFCPIQVQVQCIDDAMLRHEREQKDAGQEDVEVAPRRDMTARSLCQPINQQLGRVSRTARLNPLNRQNGLYKKNDVKKEGVSP